jgi:hypothetical protein
MGKPPTKGQWKELLNKEIDKYWKNEHGKYGALQNKMFSILWFQITQLTDWRNFMLVIVISL